MISHMHDTPVGLLVIDAEEITFRITCEQRKEIWNLAKFADVHAFLFGKRKDRPKRVRVGFAHGIYETHVSGRWCARSGPIPVTTRHRTAVIKSDFRFQHSSAGTKSDNHFPLHSLYPLGIANCNGSAAVRFHARDVINWCDGREGMAIWKIP